MDSLLDLHDAVKRSDLDLVREAIKNGADVNGMYNGNAPLHRAVKKADLRMVQFLIENGADPCVKVGSTDATPLHLACANQTGDTYEIIKLLLECGVDCNARTRTLTKATPILKAAGLSSNPRNIKLLLDYGADINALNALGDNVLSHAARNSLEMVEFILDQGLIDVKSYSDWPPLFSAILHDKVEVCELLLKRGVSVNKANRASNSPLVVAVRLKKCEQMVRVLLRYRANVFDRNRVGVSILKLADVHPNYDNVKKLLIERMAELELLGSSINDDDRELIENSHVYKRYFNEHREACMQEFQTMKDTKIYDNIPLYTIFMGGRQKMCGYARNKELIEALEAQDYENKFPIYFGLLKRRFLVEVEKQKLRSAAAEILSTLLQFNDPIHPVIQKILDYLRDGDLQFLIGTFDAFTINPSLIRSTP